MVTVPNHLTKTIVVLANSIKRDGRCIAGRELIKRDERTTVGGWVRPVSDGGEEGEILLHESRLPNRQQPNVLNIIQIPLLEHAPELGQPENWKIVPDSQWRRVKRSIRNISVLEEEPKDLWLQRSVKPDRISPHALQRHPFKQSLCLIKPDSFHIELYTVYNEFKGHNQKRRRAIFCYNEQKYDLGITDPDLAERRYGRFPGVDDDKKTVRLPCGDNCLLCVSLTPEFHGYHYKVLASVIEL